MSSILITSALCALTFTSFGATIYVNGTIGSPGDGTSWATAKKNIQEGLDAAVNGDQVWVRAGIYNTTETLAIPSGISLLGGFVGSEVLVTERNLSVNRTFVRRHDAALFPVITLSGTTNVVLDGLMITGGSSATGGGVSCTAVNNTNIIRKCTISGNVATNGAGIYLDSSNPVLTDCVISGNVATAGGGGIAALNSSTSVFTNCIVSGNRAATGGGARVQASSPTFLNCTMSANSANTNGGGAIYAISAAAPLVKNCLISYNGNYGIAEGDVASAPVLINNDLYKNVSRNYLRDGTIVLKNPNKINQLPGNSGNFHNGAPVYVMEGANRIFATLTAAGQWSAVDKTTTLTVGNALITPGSLVGRTIAFGTGNSPRRQALILANTVNRILVQDIDGSIAPLATVNLTVVVSDYHLQAGSGAINKGTSSGAPAVDIDGDVRPQGPQVDVGVDEFVAVAANQPPVNTVPGAQNTPEDTARVFSAVNGNLIFVSDPDAGTNPVRVTLTTTNSLLTLNSTTGLTFVIGDGTQDVTMTFVGTLTNINAALNGLSLQPNPNFNGVTTLTITTNDQGNTGSGGPLSDTDIVTITVGPANDAPVNTVPGPQSTPEGTPLIFSAGTGNQVSVADVDAGTNQVSATLVAINGTISLSTISGLSFSEGTGTGDNVASFQGTLTNIDAALQGSVFQPDASFNGAASLNIAVNDNGFTGLGGALTDSDSISITVNPITNIPQLANVAVTQNIIEGGSATVSGSIVDADSNETYTVTINWGDGSAATVLDLIAGATSFNTNHVYADDDPSLTASDPYTVTVNLLDAGGQSDSASVGTTVLNANPVIDTFSITPAVDEGTTATLNLTFSDVGAQDSHNVIVDWGDGFFDSYDLPAGVLSLSVGHQFLDDVILATPFDITNVQVVVSDDDTGTDDVSGDVTVSNIAPILTNVTMPIVAAVDANFTLSGNIIDPGLPDAFELNVDWGDGETDLIPIDPGTTSFNLPNSYAAPGTYTATIILTDDDGGSFETSRTIHINNDLIALEGVAVTGPVAEGTTATITGQVGSSNADATITLTIDWSDGSPDVITVPPGTFSFSADHLYTDDNPTATPSDLVPVSVTAEDTDARSTLENVNTTVNNVAPQLSSMAFDNNTTPGGTAILNGDITDPGVDDTFSLQINWGDGQPTQTIPLSAGSTSFSEPHVYTNAGDFQAEALIIDDDTGAAVAHASINVSGNLTLSNVAITSPVSEGSSATLTGNISAPNSGATMTLDVNWGDGGSTQSIPLGAGTTSFNVSHLYADDNPTATPSDIKPVSIFLKDSDLREVAAQTQVTVNNVAPQLSSVAFAAGIQENGTATLNGNIADPGTQDTFSLTINWGDGSPAQVIPLAAGTTAFSRTHQYLQSGNYSATVTVTDDDTGSANTSANLTVSNAAPQLSGVAFAAGIQENGTATLNGNIADAGTLDTFNLTINWGDGSAEQVFPLAAGTTSFSRTHQYLQSGNFSASVTVTDVDNGSANTTANLAVSNVAPTLNSISVVSPVNIGQNTSLSANIVDPGTLDSFTITVDWGDGTPAQIINRPAGSTSFNAVHTYADPGTYPIDITITDSDNGSNNYDTTADVSALANLSVTKSAPANTQPNGNLNYTITITNNGPSAAHNVVMDDLLPAAVAFTNATTTLGTVGFSSGNVHATLGTMNSGQSATVTVFTTVSNSASGSISNTATVDADEGDPNTANNSTSASTTVLQPAVDADLQLNVTAPSAGAQGLPLTYTMTITNAGPVAATNVVLTDLLPNTVEFISATPDANTTITGGLFEGGVVTATFASIPVSQSRVVTLTVRPFVVGTLVNNASVSGAQFDPSLSNNTDGASSDIAQRTAPDFQAQYLKIPIAKCSLKNGITKCAVGGQLAITNPGAVTTQTILVTTLLSNDGVPDDGDTVLRQSIVKVIKLGKTKKLKIKAKLPFNTGTSGKFLLVRLDALDQVPNEIRERNNLVQFGPFQ